MAIRINRVYTRTGDKGETALVGGQRVPKDSLRIAAFGTVDEVNSLVGLVVAEITADSSEPKDATLTEILESLSWVQHKLFDLGAYLATPPEKFTTGMPTVGAGDIERLEKAMDRWEKDLPELTSFVLPGGGKITAWLHVSRTVCRRSERLACQLNRESELDPVALAFLNRLSDFFFVAARRAAKALGEPEILWQPAGGQESDGNGPDV